MKDEIFMNLENPGKLESLYRENKASFKNAFNQLYPEIREKTTARFWNERLNFENDEISWGTGKELFWVILAAFVAALIAKIPSFTGIDPEYFYPRNISLIIFPILTIYFAWKHNVPSKSLMVASLAILISTIYINILPNDPKSDTLILACIHLPLLLWAVLGFTFVGGKLKNYSRRIDFLRYNGDLVVMTAIIAIAGGLLTAVTLGLFSLIEIQIEDFYFEYVVISGLAAAPIIGTHLVQTNPLLVNKVSPVIAKVFTPLVFITLAIYLVAVLYTGKDPYNDREFLLIFNLLLIGVMALILFSIAETSKGTESKINSLMLIGLSIVTIIVNGIALSAIVFRISEWGFTPNRLAVLGGNILILTNLLVVTYWLFKATRNNNDVERVGKSIASFLPVYFVWTLLVIFVFPLLFNFK